MRKRLFWLNDQQWSLIKRHLPTNLTGPQREDDRRVISGIVHMLQSGARWRDCPSEYGPYTTIITASIAGPSAAAGERSLQPWPERARIR
jgi:transposase